MNLKTARKEFEILFSDRYRLKVGKTTKIMGILNVTNDSFSKDGIYKSPEQAKDQALKMIEEGADMIDIGGESTRPGAQPVTVEEERERVIPVIKKVVKEAKVPVSIDTYKSEVARAALDEGACLVNDISGLKFDSRMAGVVSHYKCGCVLMHIQGTPRTMQEAPFYTSVIDEVINSLEQSTALASHAGIDRNRLLIDPGIGFGKTTEQSLEIIKRLSAFSRLNLPILIGTSRKSFIGNVLNLPVEQRLLGTATSVALAIYNGAHIVRVHDVREIVQVVKMADAILN